MHKSSNIPKQMARQNYKHDFREHITAPCNNDNLTKNIIGSTKDQNLKKKLIST